MIPQVSGYTNCNGIEDGDVVIISYTGEFVNGSQFDANDDARFVITRDKLIDGFYYNVLGMKLKERKTFIVPPEEGYVNPDEVLFGTPLVFEIFIKETISDIILCQGGSNSDGTSSFKMLLNIFMGITGSALLFLAIRSQLAKTKIKLCKHCLQRGIRTKAVGLCGKCGTPHCSSSFAKGCTECNANTFARFH